ncbi:MAG: transcription antitermination factor NusB [Ignavibacteriaceae bacterium]|nr:transcription antitermination factor NusB [Ignavibacteriaceae bacterium]
MQEEHNISDPRHTARVLAVQYLFSQYKHENEPGFQSFEVESLLQILEEEKYDKTLYEKLIDGVEANVVELDSIITQKAPEWPIDQINPVNLSILRLALWEGFVQKITPPKVVINEAIEMAKQLSSEADGAFINGVLGNIYNELKQQEESKQVEPNVTNS